MSEQKRRMAAEFRELTLELDGLRALAKELGRQRSRLARVFIDQYGMADATAMLDQTETNIHRLLARNVN